MSERIALIGFDSNEAKVLSSKLSSPAVAWDLLPRIRVIDGRLEIESPDRFIFMEVSKVIFHGIFEHDLDFFAGLALWGGPCFPNPVAMMDCRLRLPCLVKALRLTRFGGQRGFASPKVEYPAVGDRVAKWGNWHCGENKQRIDGAYLTNEATLFEPFVEGEAVRVIIFGQNGVARQARMTGRDWKKSIHGEGAIFMPLDPALEADTREIQRGLDMDIIANDYISGPNGNYLLEVNHIPNVTVFPELWSDYIQTVTEWANRD
jgi:hypothetical protein